MCRCAFLTVGGVGVGDVKAERQAGGCSAEAGVAAGGGGPGVLPGVELIEDGVGLGDGGAGGVEIQAGDGGG